MLLPFYRMSLGENMAQMEKDTSWKVYDLVQVLKEWGERLK